jgi:hypothetical protein
MTEIPPLGAAFAAGAAGALGAELTEPRTRGPDDVEGIVLDVTFGTVLAEPATTGGALPFTAYVYAPFGA